MRIEKRVSAVLLVPALIIGLALFFAFGLPGPGRADPTKRLFSRAGIRRVGTFRFTQ